MALEKATLNDLISIDKIHLDRITERRRLHSVLGRKAMDILHYDQELRQAVVLRLMLNDIMVIDLGALARMEPQTIIHTAVELGHAIGNQHWPAVVRGTKIYVPLTVDRKVMESVMHTHNIEHVAYSFRAAEQIIPYLSPHEVRQIVGHNDHHHAYEHR